VSATSQRRAKGCRLLEYPGRVASGRVSSLPAPTAFSRGDAAQAALALRNSSPRAFSLIARFTGRDTVVAFARRVDVRGDLAALPPRSRVRLHGTPRVTVLIGERACEMWQRWLTVGALDGMLVEREIDTAVHEAAARAAVSPTTPIAIACSPAALQAWRAGRRDRLAAMVDEGPSRSPTRHRSNA
jgi:hypothetical protein